MHYQLHKMTGCSSLKDKGLSILLLWSLILHWVIPDSIFPGTHITFRIMTYAVIVWFDSFIRKLYPISMLNITNDVLKLQGARRELENSFLTLAYFRKLLTNTIMYFWNIKKVDRKVMNTCIIINNYVFMWKLKCTFFASRSVWKKEIYKHRV